MIETHSLLGILGLGLSLGLLHAFDADHIMAVSALAAKTRGVDSRIKVIVITMGYCCKWAMGHGATLFLITLALLVFGVQLPDAIPMLAEKAIGILLIVIGAWVIVQAWRNNVRLQVHRHGDVQHIHLTNESGGRHDHQPVLVGMAHGLAGSAPILALIPALGSQSYGIAFGYLGLFCLGVVMSMLVFGFFFGQMQVWLAGFGNKVFQGSRIFIGLLSIVFGGYWLLA